MTTLPRLAMLIAGVLPMTAPDARAETWRALVIANPAATATDADAAALSVARALMARGFDVLRVRDASDATIPPAAAVAPADLVVIYAAGALAPGDGLVLTAPGGARLDLAATLSSLRADGAARVVAVLDACPGKAAPPLPGARDVVALRAPADADCAPTAALAAPLAEALAKGAPFAATLEQAGGWVQTGAEAAALAAPLAASAAPGATAQQGATGPLILGGGTGGAMQPRTQGQDTAGATLAPSGNVTPVADPAAVPTPAQAQPAPPRAEAAPARVALAPQPADDRAVRPTRPGMPEPSIIVGELATSPAIDPLLASRQLTVEQRRALRRDDPETFARDLAAGLHDPAPDAMARTIQQELAAMGCYSSAVDGVWGSGSRQAVDRYVAAGGPDPGAREPGAALFRAIAGADTVNCPVERTVTRTPARAQPTAPTNRTRTPTTTQRQQPAQQRTAPARTAAQPQPGQQQPARQQPAAPRGGLGAGTLGAGMLR